MAWSDYMVMAAHHSRGSARHWFRYLRKDIDKCGTAFSRRELEELCNNEALTLFQRVSMRAAFEEGSPTREHIRRLNGRANLDKIHEMRRKYENAHIHS